MTGLNVEKNELIKSFADKGLGVGSLDNIDVVGMSMCDLEERFAQARTECEIEMSKIPDAWSPSKAVDDLIAGGFFISPKRRTIDEILAALVKRNSRAAGRYKMIQTNMTRRMDSGKLHGQKLKDRMVYRTYHSGHYAAISTVAVQESRNAYLATYG